MTSSLAVPYASLKGSQRPRIESFPPYASSSGAEVIKLARLAGISLDPWQQYELTHGLGESPDWKCPKCVHRAAVPIPCVEHPDVDLIHPWSAFEVTEVVPRQNGKSELLIARILGGLFILEEPLQIYSAHLFDTAMEVMRRLVFVVENTDDLRAEVKHRGSRMTGIKYSHGEEGVELGSGLRVRFKARTGGGGRGFSCDCLYLDEAMILPESFLGATVPTLSARANPQIWLAGSAPDQMEPTHDGIVLAKRRQRALAGGDESLAYFEHSAEGDAPDTVKRSVLDDPQQWALANPGLGIRITTEYVANERRAMGARQFAVERLGIGDWPDTDEDAGRKIPRAWWDACLERATTVDPKTITPVCIGFDISPDRSSGAIAVAGPRADGKWQVAVIAHGPDPADWLVDDVEDLARSHRPTAVKWDELGQAGSEADELTQRKVRKLEPANTRDLVRACGTFFDAVKQGTAVHIGQPELDAAVDGAGERTLGDAWAWSRRSSSADITPLVAVTLALSGAIGRKRSRGGAADTASLYEQAQAEAAAMAAALRS